MNQTVEFENSPHVVRLNLRDPSSITDRLEPYIYKIKIHPKLGILLPKIKPLYTLPATVHGAKTKRASELIWSAFERREGIMGALVTGLKGSGKSLLSETLANRALKAGMPVFIVDDPELELDVLELVAKHCEPCVFIFDEFAKVYKDEKQENLLTFFSSTSFTKVLCLMAENESKSVNTYLLNRPGRMLFHLRYKNVSIEEAREVSEHFKVLPEITEEICKYVEVAEVSMDILRTICAEASRCTTVEEFKELFEILNIPKMEFFEYTIRTYGDRDVQLDMQRKYTFEAKLLTAGAIEITRTNKETKDQIVDVVYPVKDDRLELARWTGIRVESARTSRPPVVGGPLDIKWEYDLKDWEEREKQRKSQKFPSNPPFPISDESIEAF